MKKLMLILLLGSLLVMRTTAEPKRSSENLSETEQTKSRRLFSEDEVRTLVEQIKAEAQDSIDRAYDEGYKAGVKEYAPKLEAERILRENLEAENKKIKSQTWQTPWLTIAGTAAGVFTGFLIKGFIDMGGR